VQEGQEAEESQEDGQEEVRQEEAQAPPLSAELSDAIHTVAACPPLLLSRPPLEGLSATR
jgi:hypothetical protein